MCALETPAKPEAISLRRVHSPPATSAAETSPPKNRRRPGPIRPASIEYLTRKMMPSASATPPIQTVQRVPNFSSKLCAGCSSAAGGGGAAAADAGSETGVAVDGGSGACGGSAVTVSGGAAAGAGGGVAGCGTAAAIGAAPGAPANLASSASKRASIPRSRSPALTALTSATMAMIGNDNSSSPSRTNSMERPRRANLCQPSGRQKRARAQRTGLRGHWSRCPQQKFKERGYPMPPGRGRSLLRPLPIARRRRA